MRRRVPRVPPVPPCECHVLRDASVVCEAVAAQRPEADSTDANKTFPQSLGDKILHCQPLYPESSFVTIW